MNYRYTRTVAGGMPCPKCPRTMMRNVHGDDWNPKPGQPFYFAWWDKCRCGHIQLYEQAKIWLKRPRKKKPKRHHAHRKQRPALTQEQQAEQARKAAAAADHAKTRRMFDMDDFDRALLK